MPPQRCAQILEDGTQCPNRRRRAQAAKYCEQHSRSKGYMFQNQPATTKKLCHCTNEFTVLKTTASPVVAAWREFCSQCHEATPLTCDQLKEAKVPPDTVRAWLRLREKLACDICDRQLNRRSKLGMPVIDHDHSHCHQCSGRGCGKSIRGILCMKCNLDLGHLESVQRSGRWDAMIAYVTA